MKNLESFLVPEKIYFKKGCLPVALEELKYILNKKKVCILVSGELYHRDWIKPAAKKLHELGIAYAVQDSDADTVRAFEPDCILAYGTDCVFEAAAKRMAACAEDVYYITVPSRIGESSHVMPLPDGSFPDMTIIDTDVMQFHLSALQSALHLALDALASDNATDYSDGMAVRAVEVLLNYPVGWFCEQLANAGTMAGLAFVNAHAEKYQYTGHENICAEKLGMTTDTLTEKLKAFSRFKFKFIS